MPTARRVALPLAALIAAAPLTGCIAAHVAPEGDVRAVARTLRVSGEGRAQAKPDVAVASFGVEATAPQLADASRVVDARMKAVLAALALAGISGPDVQTSRYDVAIDRRQDPRGGQSEPAGYRVATEVRATMRDLTRVGAILDAVVKAGGNQIHSLAFQKEDPSADLSRARAAAVAAARAKAEELARAAGVRVGEVLEIAEGGGRPAPVAMFRMRAMADEGAAPVEPGQLDFTVGVDVTFGLK